jgi:hypothetical protein
MTILNPSFEDPDGDTIAWPENWSAYAVSFVWGYRLFGSPYLAVESMSYGWLSCEDSLDEFELSDIDDRLFGTDLDHYDDFEDQWGNEPVYDEWPAEEVKTFDLAGDAHEDFEEEWPSRHQVIDTRWIPITSQPDPGTPSEIHDALNATKAAYVPHIADTAVHSTADTTNTISSADATDLSSSVALVNELWIDCLAHIVDSGLSWHNPDGPVALSTLAASAYPASTYDDCAELVLFLMLRCNTHFSWADCSGVGYVESFIDPPAYPITHTRRFLLGVFCSYGDPTVDDFEGGWRDNENAIPVFIPGSHLDDFDFQSDGGPVAYENFETLLTLSFPGVSATAGSEQPLSPSCGSQVDVGGTFVGTAHVETRNAGSATWVQRSTITSVPVTVKLAEGYEAVRIYTEIYTSGSPTATLHHRDLE